MTTMSDCCVACGEVAEGKPLYKKLGSSDCQVEVFTALHELQLVSLPLQAKNDHYICWDCDETIAEEYTNHQKTEEEKKAKEQKEREEDEVRNQKLNKKLNQAFKKANENRARMFPTGPPDSKNFSKERVKEEKRHHASHCLLCNCSFEGSKGRGYMRYALKKQIDDQSTVGQALKKLGVADEFIDISKAKKFICSQCYNKVRRSYKSIMRGGDGKDLISIPLHLQPAKSQEIFRRPTAEEHAAEIAKLIPPSLAHMYKVVTKDSRGASEGVKNNNRVGSKKHNGTSDITSDEDDSSSDDDVDSYDNSSDSDDDDDDMLAKLKEEAHHRMNGIKTKVNHNHSENRSSPFNDSSYKDKKINKAKISSVYQSKKSSPLTQSPRTPTIRTLIPKGTEDSPSTNTASDTDDTIQFGICNVCGLGYNSRPKEFWHLLGDSIPTIDGLTLNTALQILETELADVSDPTREKSYVCKPCYSRVCNGFRSQILQRIAEKKGIEVDKLGLSNIKIQLMDQSKSPKPSESNSSMDKNNASDNKTSDKEVGSNSISSPKEQKDDKIPYFSKSRKENFKAKPGPKSRTKFKKLKQLISDEVLQDLNLIKLINKSQHLRYKGKVVILNSVDVNLVDFKPIIKAAHDHSIRLELLGNLYIYSNYCRNLIDKDSSKCVFCPTLLPHIKISNHWLDDPVEPPNLMVPLRWAKLSLKPLTPSAKKSIASEDQKVCNKCFASLKKDFKKFVIQKVCASSDSSDESTLKNYKVSFDSLAMNIVADPLAPSEEIRDSVEFKKDYDSSLTSKEGTKDDTSTQVNSEEENTIKLSQNKKQVGGREDDDSSLSKISKELSKDDSITSINNAEANLDAANNKESISKDTNSKQQKSNEENEHPEINAEHQNSLETKQQSVATNKSHLDKVGSVNDTNIQNCDKSETQERDILLDSGADLSISSNDSEDDKETKDNTSPKMDTSTCSIRKHIPDLNAKNANQKEKFFESNDKSNSETDEAQIQAILEKIIDELEEKDLQPRTCSIETSENKENLEEEPPSHENDQNLNVDEAKSLEKETVRENKDHINDADSDKSDSILQDSKSEQPASSLIATSKENENLDNDANLSSLPNGATDCNSCDGSQPITKDSNESQLATNSDTIHSNLTDSEHETEDDVSSQKGDSSNSKIELNATSNSKQISLTPKGITMKSDSSSIILEAKDRDEEILECNNETTPKMDEPSKSPKDVAIEIASNSSSSKAIDASKSADKENIEDEINSEEDDHSYDCIDLLSIASKSESSSPVSTPSSKKAANSEAQGRGAKRSRSVSPEIVFLDGVSNTNKKKAPNLDKYNPINKLSMKYSKEKAQLLRKLSSNCEPTTSSNESTLQNSSNKFSLKRKEEGTPDGNANKRRLSGTNSLNTKTSKENSKDSSYSSIQDYSDELDIDFETVSCDIAPFAPRKKGKEGKKSIASNSIFDDSSHSDELHLAIDSDDDVAPFAPRKKARVSIVEKPTSEENASNTAERKDPVKTTFDAIWQTLQQITLDELITTNTWQPLKLASFTTGVILALNDYRAHLGASLEELTSWLNRLVPFEWRRKGFKITEEKLSSYISEISTDEAKLTPECLNSIVPESLCVSAICKKTKRKDKLCLIEDCQQKEFSNANLEWTDFLLPANLDNLYEGKSDRLSFSDFNNGFLYGSWRVNKLLNSDDDFLNKWFENSAPRRMKKGSYRIMADAGKRMHTLLGSHPKEIKRLIAPILVKENSTEEKIKGNSKCDDSSLLNDAVVISQSVSASQNKESHPSTSTPVHYFSKSKDKSKSMDPKNAFSKTSLSLNMEKTPAKPNLSSNPSPSSTTTNELTYIANSHYPTSTSRRLPYIANQLIYNNYDKNLPIISNVAGGLQEEIILDTSEKSSVSNHRKANRTKIQRLKNAHTPSGVNEIEMTNPTHSIFGNLLQPPIPSVPPFAASPIQNPKSNLTTVSSLNLLSNTIFTSPTTAIIPLRIPLAGSSRESISFPVTSRPSSGPNLTQALITSPIQNVGAASFIPPDQVITPVFNTQLSHKVNNLERQLEEIKEQNIKQKLLIKEQNMKLLRLNHALLKNQALDSLEAQSDVEDSRTTNHDINSSTPKTNSVDSKFASKNPPQVLPTSEHKKFSSNRIKPVAPKKAIKVTFEEALNYNYT